VLKIELKKLNLIKLNFIKFLLAKHRYYAQNNRIFKILDEEIDADHLCMNYHYREHSSYTKFTYLQILYCYN